MKTSRIVLKVSDSFLVIIWFLLNSVLKLSLHTALKVRVEHSEVAFHLMNLFKNRPSKQMPPNEHLHMENYPLPFKYEAPFQEIISKKNKISKTAIKICVSLIKQKWKITQ